jgi:hypothetical protein
MVRLWRIAAWPLVVTVPVLVAGLMATVAVATSQVVLWRFAQDQKSNLELLTGAYLDGLSAAVLPALVRREGHALFDILDRAQGDRYAGVEPRLAILTLPNGLIIASSDPRRFPVHSAVPDALRQRFPASRDGLEIDPNTDRAWLARTLRTEGVEAGRLFAEVDIAASSRVRREILLTLVLVNGCLTLAFALGGYFVLKRMLQPSGVLTRYVEQIREGRGETFTASFPLSKEPKKIEKIGLSVAWAVLSLCAFVFVYGLVVLPRTLLGLALVFGGGMISLECGVIIGRATGRIFSFFPSAARDMRPVAENNEF